MKIALLIEAIFVQYFLEGIGLHSEVENDDIVGEDRWEVIILSC